MTNTGIGMRFVLATGKTTVAANSTELYKQQRIEFIRANRAEAMTLYDELADDCRKISARKLRYAVNLSIWQRETLA